MIEVKSVIQNSFSELFGGLYSGSLAILTDAAHLLTDMSSFIISLVAIHLSERPGTCQLSSFTVCDLGTISANRVLTYGWHRAEVLGALISIEAIWVMTAILVYSGGFHFRWFENSAIEIGKAT